MEQKGVEILGGGPRIENDPIRLSQTEPPNRVDAVVANETETVTRKDDDGNPVDEEGNVIAED